MYRQKLSASALSIRFSFGCHCLNSPRGMIEMPRLLGPYALSLISGMLMIVAAVCGLLYREPHQVASTFPNACDYVPK
jgi:hypothetical protein